MNPIVNLVFIYAGEAGINCKMTIEEKEIMTQNKWYENKEFNC